MPNAPAPIAPTAPTACLGIDIAKATFDAALLSQNGKPKHRSFPNDPEGFAQLATWLKQNLTAEVAPVSTCHACLEATSHYGDALARYLLASGHVVSVVNPAAIRAFARAEMARTKTDKADALRIARYCRLHQPRPWEPPSEATSTLQALVRRLEALKEMHQMESNRQDGAPAPVRASLAAVLSVLAEQIQAVEQQIHDHIDAHPDLKRQSELLTSIPGMGAATAAALLAELGEAPAQRFDSARQAAAFCGLVPRLHTSGTSVRGRSVLCKLGGARLRTALYFPALSALRFNPAIRQMAERLRAAGKSGYPCSAWVMAIVGAAMRKLVHLAFGVLKSGKPFDPSWGISSATP